ncbi:MAG: hypothetical protein H5T64_03815 [Chloroflexi bacterium]|nr:hypothetical protein [Chloroflexota bacterium]
MIKVKLPFKHKCFDGENVWVKPLSEDIGEICNLPYFAIKFKYKDVIRFDPETGEFAEKVADGGFTRTKFYQYKGRFSKERTYWESRGYVVENFLPGILGVTRKRKRGKRAGG